MTSERDKAQVTQAKILEGSIFGPLVIPVAIVLIGASIIFGVTKMLSTDQSYKDLVGELKSKAFGNKWVAALELSKVIAAKKIPSEEIPWLLENLEEVFDATIDQRTRDFVIVAAGALRDKRALPLIQKGLADKDGHVQFHAIVALGNLASPLDINWEEVIKILESDDHALIQASILALGQHRIEEARIPLQNFLNHASLALRYASATALISFKDQLALPVLSEILQLKAQGTENSKMGFSTEQVFGLKTNILFALQKSDWKALDAELEKMLESEKDLRVLSRLKDVLKKIK